MCSLSRDIYCESCPELSLPPESESHKQTFIVFNLSPPLHAVVGTLPLEKMILSEYSVSRIYTCTCYFYGNYLKVVVNSSGNNLSPINNFLQFIRVQIKVCSLTISITADFSTLVDRHPLFIFAAYFKQEVLTFMLTVQVL